MSEGKRKSLFFLLTITSKPTEIGLICYTLQFDIAWDVYAVVECGREELDTDPCPFISSLHLSKSDFDL